MASPNTDGADGRGGGEPPRPIRQNADELDESIICHVLADISQVCDEDQWSLRERLKVIQRICDGSEYERPNQ